MDLDIALQIDYHQTNSGDRFLLRPWYGSGLDLVSERLKNVTTNRSH